MLSIRRADGRELSLQEFTMLQALSAAETIRSEEVVLRVPDGRRVTVLMNATPFALKREIWSRWSSPCRI